MTETTTIEITQAQKAELDTLKTSEGEAYKGVLQRLIEHYNNNPEVDETRVREIVADMVVVEALE